MTQPLFAEAQRAQAVLLTTDRDFAHTIPHLFEQHRGVVVVALHQPNRSSIVARLECFLDHAAGEDLRNKVFLLGDTAFRVWPASKFSTEEC